MKAEGKRYREAMKRPVGRDAVSSAKDISALKDEETAKRPTLETVKYVGDKTFYLRDNIWIDSKYKEGIKVRKMKYLSEKYFDILRRKPKLGKYFAIAKNIIVIYEKECYQITQ